MTATRTRLPHREPNGSLQVVGYSRVSTEEQGQHGVSLAAQKERIEAQCHARGWTVLRTYTDVASGKDLKRPGLQRLLEDAKKGEIEAVVFTKLDRLSRKVSDWGRLQEELRKHEVALCSISEGLDDTTPVGRAMGNIIATFAQLERETIVERIKVALAYKKEHLHVYSRHAPYGFKRKADRLLPNAEETKVVEEIFKRRRELKVRQPGKKPRGETLREIADALNRKKIPTPKGGKQWSAETVRLILRNAPLYGQVMNGLL